MTATATPLPFLQRLAPAAQGGLHAARAALPARFAPAEGSGMQGPALSTAASAAMPTARATADPPAAPAPRAPLHHAAAPAPAPRHAVAATEPARQPTLAANPLPQARARTPRAAWTAETRPLAGPPPRAGNLQASPAAPVWPIPRPTGSSAEPVGVQPRGATALLAAARPPLSPETVARRAGPRAAEAPVVHVTIDRLDVRLPAAAPPPVRPAAPRGPATLPLADYLRQRRGGTP